MWQFVIKTGELHSVVVGAMYWFYRQTHKKVKCLTAFPNEALLETKNENITQPLTKSYHENREYSQNTNYSSYSFHESRVYRECLSSPHFQNTVVPFFSLIFLRMFLEMFGKCFGETGDKWGFIWSVTFPYCSVSCVAKLILCQQHSTFYTKI